MPRAIPPPRWRLPPAPLIYPHAPAAALHRRQSLCLRSTVARRPPRSKPAPQGLRRQASVGATIEVVVGRKRHPGRHFSPNGARQRLTSRRFVQLPGIRQSLDFLKPGDAIKLTHTDGEIKELTRKVSETQTLTVVRKDAGFAAKMIDNPVETRTRTATATIDSSLFQAAEAADISDMVALKLANVFAWDIDFVLDIREGDRFTVAYEQIYQDGKYLRDGEVLAAEFVNSGKVYRAVRFAADTGAAGYYTPEGLPMRKAFSGHPSNSPESARYSIRIACIPS